MDNLEQYSVPLKGLKSNEYMMEYVLDKAFFDSFENSAIHNAQIVVQLMLDVKPNMYVFHYRMSGSIESECDRCLHPIHPAIQGENSLILKIVENLTEHTESDDEIVFVQRDEQKYNFAKDMYDFVHLSLPIRLLCEDENACDSRVDTLLKKYNANQNSKKEYDPRWSGLLNLKNKK